MDLSEAMPRLLSTLESLMEASGEGRDSAAPVPEDVASAIDDMAPPPPPSSSRIPGGSSAAARLEFLPMEGLIANAWCGLAFWAMERAAATPATTAPSPAGATNESNSDRMDEDGGGKGKGKGKAKEKEKEKEKGEANRGSATAAAEDDRPLLVLLRWLLGGATGPSNGSRSEAATNEESAAGGRRSSAEDAGLAPATPVASTEKLVRWKASLLYALIRGLSRRLAVSGIRIAPGTETDDSDATGNLGSAGEPPERAWLDTLVDVSSLYPGGSSVCPECALAGGVVRDAVLRERGKGKDGDGGGNGGTSVGGEQYGDKRQAKPPPSRFPLWQVLLEAVLRGKCGWNKHGGGDRRCHAASVLPRVFLTEALALSPSGRSAWLLESLYKGAFHGTERGDHGARATEPEDENIHGKDGGSRGVLAAKRRQEEQGLALAILGHAWRAEASRVLLAWKKGRLPRPNPPSSPRGSTGEGASGCGQEARLLRDGGAAGNPPQQESSDELRQDTGSTLLLLLRTASCLLSPTGAGAACNRSRGEEGAGAAAVMVGARAPGGRTAARDGEQVGARRREGMEEPLVSNREDPEEGGAQGWSKGARRLAAAKSMLGAESATLWSEIFEARSSSRTHAAGGFTRLVKHLAKACGSCALSAREAEEAAVVGRMSGISGGNAESLTGAWGELVFSQTQPQQDKGAVASTPEGEKPAPAAAAAAAAAVAASRNTLAPPPPFFSLPVLTAAARALLTAAPKETKVKERNRAWKAGLATLAWTLTSRSTDTIPPQPQPQPQPRSSPASSATTAAEEGEIAVAGVCRCLSAVRSTLATAADSASDSLGVNWRSGATFPLDEASLSSVSQLLATALGRSHAVSTAPGVSPGKVVGAAEEPRVACAAVAAVPAVQSEVESLVVCVLSAVKSVRPELLAGSPGLLSALSPALEAVLDLPASRSVDFRAAGRAVICTVYVAQDVDRCCREICVVFLATPGWLCMQSAKKAKVLGLQCRGILMRMLDSINSKRVSASCRFCHALLL